MGPSLVEKKRISSPFHSSELISSSSSTLFLPHPPSLFLHNQANHKKKLRESNLRRESTQCTRKRIESLLDQRLISRSKVIVNNQDTTLYTYECSISSITMT
ncbi:hypothetical protein PHAVU_006G221700 [Phaseolus vulgaris]|uniref:Uncharacterized protein n=1 Tax=Phaseolus vulgaris TaxID=3885 RepID=V7BU85_PHAVU|nr:hypothetical protein PHAVU_006G221700g [Phaseolus vulgaris]ESW20588.1 hypothetical protein PHAVU_006G221700g [Phaseolus vulgaris]